MCINIIEEKGDGEKNWKQLLTRTVPVNNSLLTRTLKKCKPSSDPKVPKLCLEVEGSPDS